jgi:predicted AAA+ superfamily ATPase
MYHACVTFSLGKRMTHPIPSSLRRQIANLKWSASRGGRSGRCGSCVDRRIR